MFTREIAGALKIREIPKLFSSIIRVPDDKDFATTKA
jgi:hypothetical protein